MCTLYISCPDFIVRAYNTKETGRARTPLAPTLYALASFTISSRAENTMLRSATSSSGSNEETSSVKSQISTGGEKRWVGQWDSSD